jgi:maleylpyruvate isomerase
MLKLYSYCRSSAAYRVRIALEIKGLEWQSIPVNLLKSEQVSDEYRKINPQALVPTLLIDQQLLSQSLAIIEWLEERFPTPALLPFEPLVKAQVRALAYQIAIDIHPLNNLRVLSYLRSEFGIDETHKNQWYRHWIEEGFTALERTLVLAACNGRFCLGNKPTLADICLVPQVYNARRFNCDLTEYPLILSVWNHCASLPAFENASPEFQVDGG